MHQSLERSSGRPRPGTPMPGRPGRGAPPPAPCAGCSHKEQEAASRATTVATATRSCLRTRSLSARQAAEKRGPAVGATNGSKIRLVSPPAVKNKDRGRAVSQELVGGVSGAVAKQRCLVQSLSRGRGKVSGAVVGGEKKSDDDVRREEAQAGKASAPPQQGAPGKASAPPQQGAPGTASAQAQQRTALQQVWKRSQMEGFLEGVSAVAGGVLSML